MRRLTTTIVFVWMACAAQANAAILWGVSHRSAEQSLSSHLYTIDPLTGVTTLVGDTGFGIVALDYYDGTLYAIQRGAGNLLTLDTTTGAGTIIGPTGVLPNNQHAVQLAIDSAGNAFTWYEAMLDDLASVDLSTGAATYVGDAGPGVVTHRHGLAFVGSTLYLINNGGTLFTVDTTTGAATETDDILGYTAHHGDVNPDDGLYYGLDDTFSGNNINKLVAGNLATGGLAMPAVPLDRYIQAIAFEDDAVEGVIPEPATATIWSVLLLTGAAARWRRKQ